MADLRQAAMQALKSLETLSKLGNGGTDGNSLGNTIAQEAREHFFTALAQPEQEPDAQRFTEQQLRDYGSAEFERAVVLAMQATRPFGKTGDVIAVSIAHIKRSEA